MDKDLDLSRLPGLPPRTIMQVEVGSTAHGTGSPGQEDTDILAVYVEELDDVFNPMKPRPAKNVMQRTQPEGVKSGPGDIDRTIYPLRNFLNLCASGNPSVMLALWSPVIESNEFGRALRARSDIFVARSIIPRFQGYMNSNLSKLVKTGRRDLIEKHGYDTKAAMHAVRLGYQCVELMETGKLVLPIQEAGDELRAIREGNHTLEFVLHRCDELSGEMDDLKGDRTIRESVDIGQMISLSRQFHETHFVGI